MRPFFKSACLFLTLLCGVITTHAQTPGHIRLLESGTLDIIHKVSDGGYITMGVTGKVHVIKWSENFDQEWSLKLDDVKFYTLQVDVVETYDGNFFVGAASTEFGGSVMILKLNATGDLLWQKNYSVNGNFLSTFFLSEASGHDNGFVFGGGQCAYSNFVIKCDEDGNVDWQKQYIHSAGSGVQTAFEVLVDGDDYILSSSFGINSLFTLRLSSTGTVLSHTAYTTTNGNQITPDKIIRLTNNNRFAIVGNSNNNQASFVAILDNNLALVNYYEIVTPYTQFSIKDVAAINNGADIILSSNITTGTFGVDQAGFSSTLKMNQSGTISWTKRREGVNTLGSKNVYAGGLTTSGNTLFQGGGGIHEGATITILDGAGNGPCNDVASTITVNPVSLATTAGIVNVLNASVTVTTVNYTVSSVVPAIKEVFCGASDLSASSEEVSHLELFPVPASEYVVIKDISGDYTAKNVCVFSADGKLVQQFQLSQTATINTSEFENGIYFISVEHAGAISTHKLIVQH